MEKVTKSKCQVSLAVKYICKVYACSCFVNVIHLESLAKMHFILIQIFLKGFNLVG